MVACWILWLLAVVLLCTSMSHGQSEMSMIHAFNFDLISPRSADVLIAESCNSDSCKYQINIMAALNRVNKSYIEDYNTPINTLLEVFVAIQYNSSFVSTNRSNVVNALPSLNFHVVDFFTPKNTPFINTRILVHTTTFDGYHSEIADYNLLFILESSDIAREKFRVDLFKSGLRRCDPTSQRTTAPSHSCVLDYIEIGTSNFDTVVGLAHSKSIKEPGGLPYSGISIDAVDAYLSQLPRSESYVLLNAAISVDKVSKNSTELATVYYLLESMIDKFEEEVWLKGCSMVGQVHEGIISFVNRFDLPYEVIQRALVPKLNINDLMHTVMIDADYDRIGLMKLDVEGIDQKLVREMLSFFESIKTASSEITSDSTSDVHLRAKFLPCILFFETWGGFINHSIEDRLSLAGYRLIHEYPPIRDKIAQLGGVEAVLEDVAAVDCSCSPELLNRAASLLNAFASSLPAEMCAAAIDF